MVCEYAVSYVDFFLRILFWGKRIFSLIKFKLGDVLRLVGLVDIGIPILIVDKGLDGHMHNLNAIHNDVGNVKYLIIIIFSYWLICQRAVPLATQAVKHVFDPLNIEVLDLWVSELLLDCLEEL